MCSKNIQSFHWSFRTTVRLGEYDQTKDQDCDNDDPEDPICSEPVQDISVKSYLAHPGFSRMKLMHDIGIVQLDEIADTRRRNIKPICLPFTQELRTLPNRFVVTGWGRTQRSSNSAILQRASMPFMIRILAEKNLQWRIGEYQSVMVSFVLEEKVWHFRLFSFLLRNEFKSFVQEKSMPVEGTLVVRFSQSVFGMTNREWFSMVLSLMA